MAEPAPELTVNDEPITASEMRGRLDHLDGLVHDLLGIVQAFATPEARAMLDRIVNNPAVKWKARRGK